MTDDPYPSIKTLTDKVVGVFIAVLTITLPISICCDFADSENNVKINKDVMNLNNDNYNQRVRSE